MLDLRQQKARQEGNLVIPNPHTAICDREAEDMVNEGFGSWMASGGGKQMSQHLLQDLPVRLIVKGLQDKQCESLLCFNGNTGMSYPCLQGVLLLQTGMLALHLLALR